MTSPFVLDVSDLLRPGALPDHRTFSGTTGERIGSEMIALPTDTEVTLDVDLRPLGETIMADAAVTGVLEVTCARCLREFHPTHTFRITEVFAITPDAITGDEGEEDLPLVENGTIDLTQALIDEAGLSLPFNPTCPDFDEECDTDDVPPPADPDALIDSRWAGLEKFR